MKRKKVMRKHRGFHFPRIITFWCLCQTWAHMTVVRKQCFIVKVFNISIYPRHTYRFASECIVSLTEVLWITIELISHGFQSVNFGGPVHFHYIDPQRWIILYEENKTCTTGTAWGGVWGAVSLSGLSFNVESFLSKSGYFCCVFHDQLLLFFSIIISINLTQEWKHDLMLTKYAFVTFTSLK